MTHQIIALQPLDDFQLLLQFKTGEQRKFDCKPYLQYPVFKVLLNEQLFKQVINRQLFIEWQPYEIDLSADTLWHESVDV
ncbi:MAG: hypothetical protein RIQ33_1343 [Bacteroidota bacterium]|jgi:hypothetical protein